MGFSLCRGNVGVVLSVIGRESASVFDADRFIVRDAVGDPTFPAVKLSRSFWAFSVLASSASLVAGTWSIQAGVPGSRPLVELDRASVQSRFAGRNKTEIETALGSAGRQILVPTVDGGWIQWDQGSPEIPQTWVYSLRRNEHRGLFRGEIRNEERRLVFGLDKMGAVVAIEWSCDTTKWRSTGRWLF